MSLHTIRQKAPAMDVTSIHLFEAKRPFDGFILPGYTVKVSTGIERYLVVVSSVQDGYVEGSIMNHPHNPCVQCPLNTILTAYPYTITAYEKRKIWSYPMLYEFIDAGFPPQLVKDFITTFA